MDAFISLSICLTHSDSSNRPSFFEIIRSVKLLTTVCMWAMRFVIAEKAVSGAPILSIILFRWDDVVDSSLFFNISHSVTILVIGTNEPDQPSHNLTRRWSMLILLRTSIEYIVKDTSFRIGSILLRSRGPITSKYCSYHKGQTGPGHGHGPSSAWLGLPRPGVSILLNPVIPLQYIDGS